jgi:hypothetical protein
MASFAPPGSAARSILAGAGWGAVQGGLQGDDLQSIAQNMLHGGEAGAAFGGGLHYLGPEALTALRMAPDAARTVTRALSRVPGSPLEDPALAPLSDAQADTAARIVARRAAKAGVTTPQDVARIHQEQFGGAPGVTAADIIGRGGTSLVSGLNARGAANVADQAEAAMLERRLQEPQQIQGAAMVEQLKERAGGEFRTALAGEHGVTSPEIERLLATEYGQRLQRQARGISQRFGRPAEGLTMGRVETPEPTPEVPPEGAPLPGRVPIRPGEAPPDLGPAEQVQVPRGPAEEPTGGRGFSLLNWLRRQGGVGGAAAGEMDAMDLGRVGGRSAVPPADIGKLRIAAHEAGYFPDMAEPPSGQQFLDAIADEVSGRKVRYAGTPADPEAVARFQAREAALAQNRSLESEQAGRQSESDQAFRQQQARDQEAQADWETRMERGGPEDYLSGELEGEDRPGGFGQAGRAAPQYEPVWEEALTPQSLRTIQKNAYDNVKRDPAGRAIPTPENLARDQFYKDLTAELAPQEGRGAIPGLRQALDTSSDYLGLNTAMQRFKGQLLGADVRTYGKMVASLRGKAGALEAAKAAAVQDMVDLANRGLLRGNKFTPPGVQQKLALLFGADQAKAFVQAMEQQAALARNTAEMTPRINSASASRLQALADEEGGQAPLASEMVQKGPKKGLGAWVSKKVGGMIAYRQTAGLPVQVLDETGRLLLADPKSFAEFLKTQDPAALKIVKPATGQLAGYLAGQATGPN